MAIYFWLFWMDPRCYANSIHLLKLKESIKREHPACDASWPRIMCTRPSHISACNASKNPEWPGDKAIDAMSWVLKYSMYTRVLTYRNCMIMLITLTYQKWAHRETIRLEGSVVAERWPSVSSVHHSTQVHNSHPLLCSRVSLVQSSCMSVKSQPSLVWIWAHIMQAAYHVHDFFNPLKLLSKCQSPW